MECAQNRLTPKLSDAGPVATMLAAESAERAAWVTLGRRSLERMVELSRWRGVGFGVAHGAVGVVYSGR